MLMFHYGIPLFNSVKQSLKNIYNNIYFYYTSILKAIKSDTLYFFEKNPSAYICSYIDVHNVNNGVAIWKYNIITKKFYQYSCLYKDVKYFPIITANIMLDDKVCFTLDEFFSDLMVERTNADYPSLQNVLEVWTYTTGIVLDRTKNYKLLYLDTNLSEYTKNIYTENFYFPVKN